MENVRGNLKRLMNRYVYGERGSYTDGDYKIVQGAYDCWFEVYIRNRFALHCVNGQVTADIGFIGLNRYKRMLKTIQEFYPDAWDGMESQE